MDTGNRGTAVKGEGWDWMKHDEGVRQRTYMHEHTPITAWDNSVVMARVRWQGLGGGGQGDGEWGYPQQCQQ